MTQREPYAKGLAPPLFHARFREDAWHHRVVEYVFGSEYFFYKVHGFGASQLQRKRISLCKYFWSVILSVLASPFVFVYRLPPKQYRRRSAYILGYSIVGILGLLGHSTVNTALGFGAAGVTFAWPYMAKLYGRINEDLRDKLLIFALGSVVATILGIAVYLGYQFGGLKLIFAVGASITIGYFVLKLSFGRHSSSYEEKQKQPSMMMQFIKAKKAKVCPIIEWENQP